jgi:hypothetical protein
LPNAHAASAAAARRLDDDREANLFGDLQDRRRIVRQAAIRTGHARHTGGVHGSLGRHLVAHGADGVGVRADETQPRCLDLFGEVGVFRKEAVAGMNGLRTADVRSKQDRRTVQIALPRRCGANAQSLVGQPHVARVRIRFRMNRYRLEPQFATGALDPKRNLTAVGNQYLVEHRHSTGKKGTSSQRNCGTSTNSSIVITRYEEALGPLPPRCPA